MLLLAVLSTALAPSSGGAPAQRDPVVGGAVMSASRPLLENAAAAANLSTLTSTVKTAGLTDTLNGPGPFTVFEPTNEAFAKLPYGTLDRLEKDALARILTYHVVPGKLSSRDLVRMIRRTNGKAVLKTLQGEEITATMMGERVVLTDAKGGMALITTPDVYQSNGVAHIVDTVLLP
ncbi:MAG TPA: fasciclin domain-containing protein [Granulicella sp.]